MHSITPHNRFKVLTVAALLATVMTVLPTGAGFYAAKRAVIDTARERSAQAADQALAHAGALLGDVSLALQAMQDTTYPPCSEEHLKKMYAVAIAVPVIAEIGYIAEGVTQCTTGAEGQRDTSQRQQDFVLSDGMAVTRHVGSVMHVGKDLMRLAYGAHYALVDSASFTDIHVDAGTGIAIASVDGNVLVNTTDSGEELDPVLLRTNQDRPAYAVRSDATLIALSHTETEQNIVALLREYTSTLALGVLLSVMTFAVSIRLIRNRLSPLAAIAEAVKRGEFVVHYQPIMDLESGACIGAEALVRWPRANGKLVSPDLFIPLAEENGLILPITDQVIAAVVADLSATLATSRALHVAINVCAQDIQSGRILDVLAAALIGSGIEPHQIWIEATERGVRDVEAASTTLIRARQLGYRTAIDDFGTGYSSLSCLERLPFDVLKIDKSFIDAGAGSGRVLKHIVALAKTLGLALVAEGIETPAQAKKLRKQGVDFGQGWLYAKAMSAPDFKAFIKKSWPETHRQSY